MAGVEHAVRLQVAEHAAHDLGLGVAVEVDQHVAQEDHVELRQPVGHGLHQVGGLEAHLGTQLAAHQHLAGLVALALQAEALQVGRRHHARPVHRIQPAAGRFHHRGGQVGADDLPRRMGQLLAQQHGRAVGLFARRAGRAPHIELLAGGHQGQAVGQVVVVLGLAEEVGLVGGQPVDQLGHLLRGRTAAQQLVDIGFQVGLAGLGGHALQPAGDQRMLGLGELDARDTVEQPGHGVEGAVGQGFHQGAPVTRARPAGTGASGLAAHRPCPTARPRWH